MENNYKYYECGDGWLPLIEDAKTIISKYNLKHPELEKIEFTQIKEKWGGLRIYLNHYIPEIYEQIRKLENISFEICEHCGTNKNVTSEYTHGWVMTLCNDCRKKEIENYNEKWKKEIV